jgi:hypothetical protein
MKRVSSSTSSPAAASAPSARFFAAVDGAQRLWASGVLARAWVTHVSGSRPSLCGSVPHRCRGRHCRPLLSVAVGLVVTLDFVLKLFRVSGVAELLTFAQAALAPSMLPVAPRLAVLLVAGAATLVVTGWRIAIARKQGRVWWRTVPSPLSAAPGIDHCWSVMWISSAARPR